MIHPLSRFLLPAGEVDLPSLAQLNALTTQRDLPLRFVPSLIDVLSDGLTYEERIFRTGAVATRANDPHDAFNALVWLAFPRTKQLLNRLHVEVIRTQGSVVRGPLRDALTLFDECGVIVAGTEPALWQMLREHRWQEVFVERRALLERTTRFVVFGHASHAALLAPFHGLCGKALFLPADEVLLAAIDRGDMAALDAALARRLATTDFSLRSPRDLQALPLLGIPGATAENMLPGYYADARQFRPPRRMAAGSSPGSR